MNKKIYLSMCNKNKCSGSVHVVEQGDTLYSIAQKYHTRVRILLDLNPFVDIYHLQPGDEICIPTDNEKELGGFHPYIIKKKESIGEILENLSISFEELSHINKVLYEMEVPVGTILLIPSGRDSGQKEK
ncbi:MAG: LysM domain-containing protein [Eubacteriales bacterium]|nr:LysM domain-containing protein [Eubacteriales bacterium]